MTQQRIDTLSITNPPLEGVDDSVIFTTSAHLQGAPTISKTFLFSDVSTSLDTITIAAHGLADDQAVYFRTSGTLAGGLSLYTTYYLVNTTANDFQLAASVAGPAIDLTSQGTGSNLLLTGIWILQGDPWNTVLSILNNLMIEPTNEVPAMDAASLPSATNRFITYSDMLAGITGRKTFVLVGPSGSGADYEGNDETPFNDAIAFLQARNASTDGGWLVILPGIYAFTTTLLVPDGIQLEGIHPSLVTLRRTSGNLAVVDLQGVSCGLSSVTFHNPTATSKAALIVSGQKCLVEKCRITNFGYVGLQLNGFRNKVNTCRFDSNSAGAVAALVQSGENNLNRCSFSGTLPNGAVKIEGSSCGVFCSFFDSTLTGYAYQVGFPYMTIPNPTVNDNRLVGNHYAAPASLSLSSDNGTDTVRYGNTPNTYDANQNNFLSPLAEFTGQPTIASSTAVLSNTFTYDPGLSDSLTEFLDHPVAGTPSLDLLIQRNFEERNYFLHSTDPTFDGVGAPLTGTFSWNGTTLNYPQFYVRSIFARNARWVVNAGSSILSAGQVLYVDINQSLSGVDIVVVPTVAAYPLALTDPTDAYRLVLAVCLSGGNALWLQGFRLLTALTSFDVDGTPLPIVRFIGTTEARNPAPPFSGFSGATQSNLTDKLSAQSAHIKALFERTNLSYEPLTADAEFNTEPTPGGWLTGPPLTSGIPAAPTHLLELETQTYGLDPGTGLYKYNLSGAGWTIIPAHPFAAPFTALAKLGTGVAILKTNGQIALYTPETTSWTTFTPALSTKLAALTPFAAARPAGFMTGGHADYQLQTDRYSYFTTLDGHTVRFSLNDNTLDWVPRAFTQDAGGNGLLSLSQKDTGYNSLRDTADQFESLDNGVSYTTGLPFGVKGKFLPLTDTSYDEFKSVDFASLIVENFSHDRNSGAFISVYRNAGTTKWYIVGGGLGTSYLYSVLASTAPQFTDFSPHYWTVNAARQEVICVGKTITNNVFAMLRGYYDLSLKMWLWVNQSPSVIVNNFAPGDVDVILDRISIIAHGFQANNQVQLTTTGTLPPGLSTGTTYFIIVVSPNIIQLSATSGGPAINITIDGGTGIHTITQFNTCQGAIAVYDDYPGGFNFGDLWVIVSNQSRGNRPTIWKRDGVSGAWSFKTLTDTVLLLEDILVPAAVTNSFNYIKSSQALAGFGSASPAGISFLVKDGARTDRPTMFQYKRSAVTYSGTRLTDAGLDVVTPQAVANSATQCFGGAYNTGSHTTYWVFKDTGSNIRLFMYHEDSGLTTVWSALLVASSGLTVPFTNRSGTQVVPDNLTYPYNPGITTHRLYLLTNEGITTLILAGNSVSLAFNQTFLPGAVIASVITLNNHGLVTGDRVTFTTTTTLPTGLSAAIEYAVVNATTNTFQVSVFTGGTPVTITGGGVGTHTVKIAGDDHVTGSVPCFSLPPATPVVSALGISRAGEPSIELGSWVLDQANVGIQTFPFGNVNTGTDTITTVSAHGFVDGDIVRIVSPTSVPGGLSPAVDYFIKNSTPTTFQLTLTYGGSVVDITTQGTGTHSVVKAAGNTFVGVQGSSFGNDPGLGGGVFWTDPGTVVKNIGSNVWMGLNRGGYLWVADATKSGRQTELKPALPAVRGDLIVSGLGTTTNFEAAFDGTGTKLGIVFADAGNGNALGFILYNLVTQLVEAYERAGTSPLNPTGTSPCITSPKVVYNAFSSSWDITVQDNSRQGGQFSFYRRLTTSASWILELVGTNADPPNANNKTNADSGPNAGLNPSRALPIANGEVAVATQNTATGNLLVLFRTVGASWNTGANLGGGGFVKPDIAQAGTTYWVVGSNNGVLASAAKSLSHSSGWASVSIPISTAYNRVSAAIAYPYSDGVAVASPLLVDGLIPANQEMGVFKFKNTGAITGQIFAAKGRLQSAFYSGEEETSYGTHSWTTDGKLLYGATRPGRASQHYSLRVSRISWDRLGDSALGSGRLLGIGDKTYREEFCDAAQPLISEFSFTHAYVRSWDDLPLAERDAGNYTALRYPFNADGGASSLFRTGNPTAGMTSDATLQSGTLGAVTSREFPLVAGKTRIQGGPGGGVLFHGAMMTLLPPPNTTSLAYFGSATIATNNMFKLIPQDTLTIKGTWRFRSPSDLARSYTITGPVSFNLDASVNGHLVLQFPTAATLTQDATANPLSYWVALDHPQTTYSIVLGELRDKFFFLYQDEKQDSRVVKLALGSLELMDTVEPIYLLRYSAPVSQLSINKVISERFYIEPFDIDSVSVKQVGALDGFQRLDFALVDGDKHLMVAQGLPPNSLGFYFFISTTDAVVSEQDSMRLNHVVGRFGNLVVFNSY